MTLISSLDLRSPVIRKPRNRGIISTQHKNNIYWSIIRLSFCSQDYPSKHTNLIQPIGPLRYHTGKSLSPHATGITPPHLVQGLQWLTRHEKSYSYIKFHGICLQRCARCSFEIGKSILRLKITRNARFEHLNPC